MSERVLRWIAAEVDAGREVSESSVVEGCEVSLGEARAALGGDWARFRVMDCGHELGQWDRQARECGGCWEGNVPKSSKGFPAAADDRPGASSSDGPCPRCGWAVWRSEFGRAWHVARCDGSRPAPAAARAAAIAPGERAVSAAEFAAIVGLPAEVHHELRPAVAPAVLSRPMGRVLGLPRDLRDLRELRGRPARPKCYRCGGRLAMEVDELGLRVDSCFACGPQYGRRPATPEDEAALYPSVPGRRRRRTATHGGMRL